MVTKTRRPWDGSLPKDILKALSPDVRRQIEAARHEAAEEEQQLLDVAGYRRSIFGREEDLF